jgi:endonuclease/exonuclease/phosphatase family metal-dependent hydrolase
MYSPRLDVVVSEEQAAWPHRAALLRDQIAAADCDVVCIQEAAADSFETDFSWMIDLGYDRCELFKKGRFRPATFWRAARVQLKGVSIHKDRCLITHFALVEATHLMSRTLYVANCHLTAGPEAARRLRQALDAVDTIRKDMAKAEPKPKKGCAPVPAPAPVVVLVGDFNAQGDSGVARLLLNGQVDAGFLEDGVSVTSSSKKQACVCVCVEGGGWGLGMFLRRHVTGVN